MTPPSRSESSADLICLSHLRWNFVFQRPQHLLTRCARERRVFYVEEPLFHGGVARLSIASSASVTVATPQLPRGISANAAVALQRVLIDQLIKREAISSYVLWYYTPMALAFTDHLVPDAVVYDCMDELSAFKGAPATLQAEESKLLARASLVLTGGHSLFEAKKHAHHNIHPFPSSVDVPHFAQARQAVSAPRDQATIAGPRLGFFGVIDERMDLALLDAVAAAQPAWQIVMIGPVVKIDPASLPRRANIHYLGAKSYQELPFYLAGWDVALLPFARNESTRFISPTKTPEYLAAGAPVVSTSISDVVRPYGQQTLVRIADDPVAFIAACAAAMTENRAQRLTRVDMFLRQMSWDRTWNRISLLLAKTLTRTTTAPMTGAHAVATV